MIRKTPFRTYLSDFIHDGELDVQYCLSADGGLCERVDKIKGGPVGTMWSPDTKVSTLSEAEFYDFVRTVFNAVDTSIMNIGWGKVSEDENLSNWYVDKDGNLVTITAEPLVMAVAYSEGFAKRPAEVSVPKNKRQRPDGCTTRSPPTSFSSSLLISSYS